jgi:hypothetical protein
MDSPFFPWAVARVGRDLQRAKPIAARTCEPPAEQCWSLRRPLTPAQQAIVVGVRADPEPVHGVALEKAHHAPS